jgi:hypothetical protein
METSEKAKAFLMSLDDQELQVGDGTDGKPVWIGVDAEAGRVYKVYANGLAQGFGDGTLLVRCGLRTNGQWNLGEGTQVTAGRDVVLSNDHELRTFECDAGPAFASVAESGDDPVLFEIRPPTGEVIKLTLHGNFDGLPAGSQVTNMALPLWNASGYGRSLNGHAKLEPVPGTYKDRFTVEVAGQAVCELTMSELRRAVGVRN